MRQIVLAYTGAVQLPNRGWSILAEGSKSLVQSPAVDSSQHPAEWWRDFRRSWSAIEFARRVTNSFAHDLPIIWFMHPQVLFDFKPWSAGEGSVMGPTCSMGETATEVIASTATRTSWRLHVCFAGVSHAFALLWVAHFEISSRFPGLEPSWGASTSCSRLQTEPRS